jgi:hypothetical protein
VDTRSFWACSDQKIKVPSSSSGFSRNLRIED